MWLIKLAWKNMWRNRQRTAITMAAIFFAVVLSILTSSLTTGVFDNLVNNLVGMYTGYIQIHKNGYWEEQNLDNSFESDKKIEQSVLNSSQVSSLSPRLETFSLVSGASNTKGCILLGIDPEKEDKITNVKSKIIEGEYIDANDNAVIVAEGLLKRLRLRVKDTLVIIGQGYHGTTAAGEYLIKGVIHLGSPELNDKLLVMPIICAQELYGAGKNITSYVLQIKDPNKISKISSSIKNNIGSRYEVMTWEEILPDIKQHIDADTKNMKIIQWVLYLLICFGIFGTLLMMMAERYFEMGMLIAIGMKKSKLVLVLLVESLFTVLGGCILGIVVSIPMVLHLNKYPLKMNRESAAIYERFGFEAIFPTSTNWSHFTNQGIIVFIIGLTLSTYTVVKIIRLNPVKALRR